ncbi:Microcystin-dependent protein [Chitinophaga costaii]|uniref:Microcystin-dependent protein n=1 Tax=Chitinophaga costaii TaxID=1335309 RepID=A0A1C4E0G0_9BACT|nr:tail fiber protein [Chitinophaga costaii]PUZ24392.1 phage tail protein [Chitinophaga costaii]SCC37049.1 Microcystin-dependent protein [Chitinophaga costaii]
MDVYMALIFIFGGNYAINGFAFCQGQALSISQNTALFSILGTLYGGNGSSSFCLPDLRGRVPRGMGQGVGLSYVSLGEMVGSESVSLKTTNMPLHTHAATLSNAKASFPASNQVGTTNVPDGTVSLAKFPTLGSGPGAQAIKGYAAPDGTTFLSPGTVTADVTIGNTGGSVPFNNLNPYLGVNYIIALQGIYPSRN